MKDSLVTVFIPAYNAEDYIKEAIDSIIKQTYRNLEILIINDGSIDNTAKIVESYKDSRIRLINNRENMGLHYTRNLGIKEARGKYLALMDADDISEIERIRKQVDVMIKDESIDVVTCHCRVFNDSSNRVLKTFANDEELKISLMFLDAICNPATMINLDKFRKLGLKYNPEYFVAEDYELWTQIAKIGKFYVINEVLLNYRFGHQNITKKSMEAENDKVRRKELINKIHNDLLDFYGFYLNGTDKDIFNLFFDDNPQYKISYENLVDIKKVINKIKVQNKENKIFDFNKFNKVIDICIMKQLRQHNMSIKDKIYIYMNCISKKNNYSINIELIKTVVRCFIKN